MLVAGAGMRFLVLLDEVLHFALFSGLFEVHKIRLIFQIHP